MWQTLKFIQVLLYTGDEFLITNGTLRCFTFYLYIILKHFFLKEMQRKKELLETYLSSTYFALFEKYFDFLKHIQYELFYN